MSVCSIAVYCGENGEMTPENLEAAALLGTELGKRGVRLVYGGMKGGLMGIVANHALEAGGEVIGVIPEFVPEELRHLGLTRLIVVPTLAARLQEMIDLSDGFIALPGGHGTFHEIENELTTVKLARKLGNTVSRVAILFDPHKFFVPYLKLVANMGKMKNADPENNKDRQLFKVCSSVDQILREIGAISQSEYDEGYSGGGAYGTLLVSSDTIAAYRKPISDREKRHEFKMAGALAGGGVAALIIGCAVAWAPITVPTVILGILGLAASNEQVCQASSRPSFNPITHINHKIEKTA